MILDGGDAQLGLESTIVDLTVEPPAVLRPGFITREALGEVLGQVEQDVTIFSDDGGQAPRTPGMKYRHYALTQRCRRGRWSERLPPLLGYLRRRSRRW